ncbi:hypothetical protein ElyMa_006033900 [Elysia marginata]|uniref:Sema domain-containing protein n=1 Tax=Elysia marginata TaxID=1093978 RepID=A0AAV4GKX4_9GAST|nr:hypothetical protein ElyMa_006033900 [Elysia marginata]
MKQKDRTRWPTHDLLDLRPSARSVVRPRSFDSLLYVCGEAVETTSRVIAAYPVHPSRDDRKARQGPYSPDGPSVGPWHRDSPQRQIYSDDRDVPQSQSPSIAGPRTGATSTATLGPPSLLWSVP